MKDLIALLRKSSNQLAEAANEIEKYRALWQAEKIVNNETTKCAEAYIRWAERDCA